MKTLALILGLALIPAKSLALKANQFDVHHTGIFAYHPASPGLTKFRASWTVPNDPNTNHDQKLAIWIGLQNETSSIVLQPVLTWGDWANGATGGWNVACWLASIEKDKEVTHKSSKTVRVYPGQKLNAAVELIGYSSGVFTYRCSFEGYPDASWTYSTRDMLNTAMLEYEVQDVKTCTDYTTENANFTNVYLASGDKNFTSGLQRYPAEDPKKCGIKVKTLNPAKGIVSIGLQ